MVTSLVVALFFDVFLPKLVFILAVDGATVLLPNAPSILFVFVTSCFVVKPADGAILAEIFVGVVVANVVDVGLVVGVVLVVGIVATVVDVGLVVGVVGVVFVFGVVATVVDI